MNRDLIAQIAGIIGVILQPFFLTYFLLYNGYMLASTWLQCVPGEGVGGPFTDPGGYSRIDDVDADIDRLHRDAGIAWWLDFVKAKYGPWEPPGVEE